MKRIVEVLLALALMLSMVACGGDSTMPTAADAEISSVGTSTPPLDGNNATSTEPTDADAALEKPEIIIGEPLKTDIVEFTLNSFEFVGNRLELGGELCDLTSDANVFACVYYSIKNVGKTKLSSMSLRFDSRFTLVYGDGYSFMADYEPQFLLEGKNWRAVLHADLEPLSAAVDIMGYINVPLELRTNIEEPLVIEVKLPVSQSGNTTHFDTYRCVIR